MTEGVIYLLMGRPSYAGRLAISLFGLRKFYKGDIAILSAEDATRPYAVKIANDPNIRASLHPIQPTLRRRHSHYVTKANLPKLSPYDISVFIDADTTVHGPISELFPYEGQLVLIQWSKWISTGRTMSGRIKRWSEFRKDLVDVQLRTPHAAVNTGVMGLPKEHPVYEEWDRLCKAHPIFIGDETAMQILYPTGPHVILSDKYNCSPMCGASVGSAHIYHYHGGKHARPQCLPYFLPAAQEAVDENVGGMRSWAAEIGDEGLNLLIRSNQLRT